MLKNYIMLAIFILLLSGSLFYFKTVSAPASAPLVLLDTVPLPTSIETVLIKNDIAIESSQRTTLRWLVGGEEPTTVSLNAQSYGLGFMSKESYDRLNASLFENVTAEPSNDAKSTVAGQSGFRSKEQRACIIGYTYTDSNETNDTATSTSEVYVIIICSRG